MNERVRKARVTTPTGLQWDVRAFRVRLPPWRELDLWGEDVSDDAVVLALKFLTLPLTLLLFPLACAIVEMPFAVYRALRSDVAWVEATTEWPREERFLWRTTRADVPTVHAAVVELLASGGTPSAPRAELVEHV
jgi:hypothetical protein